MNPGPVLLRFLDFSVSHFLPSFFQLIGPTGPLFCHKQVQGNIGVNERHWAGSCASTAPLRKDNMEVMPCGISGGYTLSLFCPRNSGPERPADFCEQKALLKRGGRRLPNADDGDCAFALGLCDRGIPLRWGCQGAAQSHKKSGVSWRRAASSRTW